MGVATYIVWTLSILLIAGCVEPPAVNEGDDTDATIANSLSSTFEYSDCEELFGIYQLPKDSVAHLVPNGFQPASLAPDPTGTFATLALLAPRCATTLGETTDLWSVVGVEPPSGLAHPEVNVALFALYTSNADVAALWSSWGSADIVQAEVSVNYAGLSDVLFATIGEVSVSTESFNLHMDTLVVGAPEATSGGGRIFFRDTNGNLSGGLDFIANAERDVITGTSLMQIEGTSHHPAGPLEGLAWHRIGEHLEFIRLEL